MSPTPAPPRPRHRWRRIAAGAIALLGVVTLAVGIFHSTLKPLPPGLRLAGPARPTAPANVEFLADVTWQEGDRRMTEQVLFDRVFRLIEGAEELLVLDLFLFNDFLGTQGTAHRPLSSELTQALLRRRQQRPDLPIVVITDPVNEAYGGSPSPQFAQLRQASIPVVSTRLERLRDSNPTWSGPWRMFLQWFGTSPGGILPHPFSHSSPGVGLRSWFALLNFKANHRKLVIADVPAMSGGRRLAALVMSANPHDGSSAHGNAGLLVHGDAALDLLRSEQAVLDFSGHPTRLETHLRSVRADRPPAAAAPDNPPVEVQVLTERAIRDSLVTHLDATGPGDRIDVAMFYLSDRVVLDALVRAAQRGVALRLLLDPNRDAFGHEKTGVPNRPVAAELLARGGPSVAVRWYDTHGEQFHTKIILIQQANRATLLAGSANLTRRNLGDLNLETDLRVSGPASTPALAAARAYFERLWTNLGHPFTLDYPAYADPSWTKRWRYRIQEATGLSSF